jgi:beta-lactamase regulating signal transducer with metallopeptidase domain
MLIAWMAYAVLFGVLTYGAALAADRIAATWGREQRHVWIVAVIAATCVPVIFATRPRPSAVPPAESGIAPAVTNVPIGLVERVVGPAREPMALRAERIVRAADPYLVRAWAIASLVWLALLARAAITVRRRRAQWRSVEIDGASVLVSPSVGPAVIGAFSPRVVIPQWSLALDAPARLLMLRHETEHIRARDPLLLFGATVATALVPWNPVVWLLARRLRLAIEIDCDHRVLRASAQRREYGELLLTVGARHSAPLPFATSLAERRPFLERRIRAMTTTTPRYPRLVSAACIGLAIVATTAAVRAPRPASLLQRAVPATPVVASPSVTAVTASDVATPETPKLSTPVLPNPVAHVPKTPVEARPTRGGPDTLSVRQIRALIEAHHPSALTGDPDINTITLVLDARGNYVTSLAESRPFAIGFARGRGGAGFGDGVGGGAGFGRGRVGGSGANSVATAQDSAEVKRRLAEVQAKLAEMAKMSGDTLVVMRDQLDDERSRRLAEVLAVAKAKLDSAQTLGANGGLNMPALSRLIDPETMDSVHASGFEPGQLGTTALRVFVVRLKP